MKLNKQINKHVHADSPCSSHCDAQANMLRVAVQFSVHASCWIFLRSLVSCSLCVCVWQTPPSKDVENMRH